MHKVYSRKFREAKYELDDIVFETLGKDPHVGVFVHDDACDGKIHAEVHWASIGTVSTEEALEFQAELSEAIRLAEGFKYNGWAVTYDESEDESSVLDGVPVVMDVHPYYDPDWQLRYVTEEEVEEYEQNGTFKAYDDEVPAEDENEDVCDMWHDYPSYDDIKRIADMMIEDGETSVRIRLAADNLQCTYDGVALSCMQSAYPLPQFIYTVIRNCHVLRAAADLVYDYEQHMETVELLKSCGCYKDDDNAEGRE